MILRYLCVGFCNFTSQKVGHHQLCRLIGIQILEKMRKNILCIFAILIVASILSTAEASGLKVTVPAGSASPVKVDVAATTGLQAVYVVADMQNVSIVYTPDSPSATVEWKKFGNLGGGYAEDLPDVGTTLQPTEGDCGYIAYEDGRQTCVWIVDYSKHTLVLNGLTVIDDRDCGRAVIGVDGYAEPIEYYTVNGRRTELSRGMTAQWNTMAFAEDAFEWQQSPATATIDSAEDGRFSITAPLCNTTLTLTGDKFLEAWGKTQSAESNTIEAFAVDCQTTAEQQGEIPDNTIGGSADDGALGGNAPAVIDFKAAVTDATVFIEWQMSKTPDFEDIILRSNERDFSYTFNDLGTTYVRFVCANNSGECSAQGIDYTVNIGESALLCPNAFSPGASEGVNDVWKVAYKSIIKFECTIFNRWGKQLYHFTDPADGWDGKIGGKIAPAGVYYYVINATGADGKRYNLKGDINIVNYK